MKRLRRWAILGLVFAVVTSMFGGTASAASTRYALVADVKGTVIVTKAGGTKEIRLFKGMGLNEGDKLKVEKGSSVTLKVADRDDEVVLGENWNGALSKLKTNKNGGTDTAVKTWSGSMYNKVEKITGTSNTYKVETPTAVMGVRGTHFTITFDPIYGEPTLIVSSGIVGSSSSGDSDPRTVVVLPSQQITLYPDADPAAGVGYVDPDNVLGNVDPEVIAAILRNKELVDRENLDIIDSIPGDPDVQGRSTLNLTEEEQLQRYRQNVENALFHIFRSAVNSGKYSEDELQDIVNAANQTISDAERKFDLNREVPPIDRTAGIDPALEQQRRAQLEQARQRQEQQQQQKEQKRQEVAQNNQSLIDTIMQRQQEQQQANQQAAEQKSQEAAGKYINQLPPSEREALENRLQEKRQEQQQQQQQRPSQPAPPSSNNDDDDDVVLVETTTVLAVQPESPAEGDEITLTATVSAPNSTVIPTGEVVFYNGEEQLGKAALSGNQAVVTVTDLAPGTYSVSAAYKGSRTMKESISEEIQLIVAQVPHEPTDPAVALTKRTGAPLPTDRFEVDIALDNFAGEKAVYGVQLHFIHGTDIKADQGTSGTLYNQNKFVNSDVVADNIKSVSGTVNGQVKVETIYALTLFQTSSGIAFDDGDILATIPFQRSATGTGTLKLAYVQIIDKDGNAIITLEGDQIPSDFEISY